MTFSSLIGNEFAKTFLEALSSQQGGAQVLLFFGPEGVGKRSFALAFAKKLLGEKHAKKIDLKVHPDVMHFLPEGKTHQHPISSIRKILEEAALPPFEASLKIYIIEEFERMLPSSSNALLKVLEEPNPYCRFLLLTSRPDEILPTIASRCVKVPFYPLDEKILAQYLVDQKTLFPEKAKQIAMKSQGSFSKAITLVEDVDDPLRSSFIDLLKECLFVPASLRSLEILTKIEKCLDKKSDQEDMEIGTQIVDRLFEDLLFWIRDLHLLKETSSHENLFHASFIQEMERQVQTRNIPSLEKVALLIEEARLALQRSFKPKTVLEKLFFELV